MPFQMWKEGPRTQEAYPGPSRALGSYKQVRTAQGEFLNGFQSHLA